jgi:hypothetical protein
MNKEGPSLISYIVEVVWPNVELGCEGIIDDRRERAGIAVT